MQCRRLLVFFVGLIVQFYFLWILHCTAVERTVLEDQWCAVDADDFFVWENILQDGANGVVALRLSVCWEEDCRVHYQEVGIRCWKSVTVFVVDGGAER